MKMQKKNQWECWVGVVGRGRGKCERIEVFVKMQKKIGGRVGCWVFHHIHVNAEKSYGTSLIFEYITRDNFAYFFMKTYVVGAF